MRTRYKYIIIHGNHAKIRKIVVFPPFVCYHKNNCLYPTATMGSIVPLMYTLDNCIPQHNTTYTTFGYSRTDSKSHIRRLKNVSSLRVQQLPRTASATQALALVSSQAHIAVDDNFFVELCWNTKSSHRQCSNKTNSIKVEVPPSPFAVRISQKRKPRTQGLR